jgi:hypothetical protein
VCNALSYRNDPIRSLTLRCTVTSALGITALVLTAWWALTPPHVPSPVIGEHRVIAEQPGDTRVRTLAALDRAAFDAVLWSRPPEPSKPEPTEQAERAAPPPELLLLAITREGDQRVAALYDKRLNRVVLAQSGDAFADVTITAITDSTVEFAWGERRSQLVLRKDES